MPARRRTVVQFFRGGFKVSERRACRVAERNQCHTLMPASHRLHDDLWQESRLECDVREREGLPFVRLPELAAMRDWADRVGEAQDVAGPPLPMMTARSSVAG